MDDSDLTNGQPESIVLWRDGKHWIIRHGESGVTTQGLSRLHALLMLADALAAYNDSEKELIAMAEDVFIPDEDILNLESELSEN